MSVKTKLVPLVVTTSHRGVFFGYGVPSIKDGEIRLEKARMCIYWSEDMRGVGGLAAIGPSATCKIGLEVPAITLNNVDAVMECTKEAVEKWAMAPFAR